MREIHHLQRILRITTTNITSIDTTIKPEFNEQIWTNLTKCIATTHSEFNESLDQFVFKTVNYTMKEFIRCLNLLDEFIRNNHRL